MLRHHRDLARRARLVAPVVHLKRFRGGLVFKAHRLVYHSTLGPACKSRSTRSTPAGAGASKCEAVPRRARIQGSSTFASLNSRLESNDEEEKGVSLGIQSRVVGRDDSGHPTRVVKRQEASSVKRRESRVTSQK